MISSTLAGLSLTLGLAMTPPQLSIQSPPKDYLPVILTTAEVPAYAEKLRLLKLEREKRIAENNRIKGVGYNPNDVTVVSDITYDEMYALLKDTTMRKLSGAFVEAEREYGVNALFLAGLVALESEWNTSPRAMRGNNIAGVAVYNDSSPGVNYDSKRECILDVAKKLRENYLVESGQYYKGLSSSNVEFYYCAKKDWNEQIDSIAGGFVRDYRSKFKPTEE